MSRADVPAATAVAARPPRARTLTALLDGWDTSTAHRVLEAASDLALVLDADGTILDVVSPDATLGEHAQARWRGRPWAQTVTVESRGKVEALMRDAARAANEAVSRWRQVNHPTPEGDDLPVLYSAVRLGARADGGGAPGGGQRFVAFGRDLRDTVALQRKLVDAQQSMERDYWRFREAETRYRHLFETSSEGVLIVDGLTQKVVEANPAARELFGDAGSRVVGATLASLLAATDADRVQGLLAAARSVGRQGALRASTAGGQPLTLSASVYRQDNSSFVLVRATLQPAVGRRGGNGAASPGMATPPLPTGALGMAFFEQSPDALVFCDAAGLVVSANRSFLALAELGSEEQARGRSLDAWLGRTGVELGVLTGTLRERGSVGAFATELRGEFGTVAQVEVSATQVQADGRTLLAFALRDTERRTLGEPRSAAAGLTRSVGELAELVGRTPMKDIVADTTDVIEQMCIQTALQMTGDNRASAAQLLGLSRQSLYVKLRRFGLMGADDGDD